MDLVHVSAAFASASGLFDGFHDCDSAVFVRAAEAVASGWFTGPVTARLLERLAIRLEAAEEVGEEADRAVAEKAYNAVVAHLEEDLGLCGDPPVRVLVEEMHMTAKLFGAARAAPLGAAVASMGLDVSGYLSVAGGAVAVTAPVPMAQREPGVGQLVLTQSVYRALLAMSVCTDTNPLFYVVRRRDGLYTFASERDVSAGCTVGSLPEGYYELPGGYGCVVPVDVIRSLLEAVWVMPEREKQRGYCYVRVVPPARRDIVVHQLGPFPSVRQLVDACPEVYTWVGQNAQVYPVTDGNTHQSHYHVASVGRLPRSVPPDVLLGGAAGSDRDMSHFNDVFTRFQERLDSSSVPVQPTYPSGRVISPPASVAASVSPPASLRLPHSSSHNRAYSTGSVSHEMGVVRARTPVFHLQPGTMRSNAATWTEYPDSVSREWAKRLGSGPPLGCTALRKLSDSRAGNLPEVPQPDGGRVMAMPPAQVTGFRGATWKSKPCPVPGWTLEALASTSFYNLTVVPPETGVMCRYEVSSDNAIEVNGVEFPGRRSVFWSDSSFGLGGIRKYTTVWRAWHVGGAAAAGLEFMSLFAAYQFPVVVPTTRDRERILCARLVGGDEGRGEEMYRATCVAAPGEHYAQIYVSDTVSGEAIVLGVSAPGLTRVNVHGMVLPVQGGCATCITDLASLVVGWCISHDRHTRRGEVTFEIRRTRGHGAGRGRVQVQRMLAAEPYEPG